MAFVDGEQIRGVFINLIKNAIQAVDDNKTAKIDVRLSKNQNKILIEVKDNGKGIPKEIQQKLFRPNFTTKNSGMGLGLAISKNAVESVHGKIWFKTEINVGSSFYVELPEL